MLIFIFLLFFRASNTFCQMACGMLSSIGDFLKMGSDEIIRNMYDISDDIDEEDSSSRYFIIVNHTLSLNHFYCSRL